jgi:hexokinase
MPMGKGFTFEITNNLSALLSNAYTSLPNADTLAPLRITAITNDSVATLLSTAYLHPPHTGTRAAAGIIAGTGTNATCLCPVSKLAVDKRRKDAEAILINTEWSINGTLPALVPIRTAWDETLAARSEKPGFQPFEEMVGGRYLGEITRLAAVELFSDGNVEIPQMMKTPYAIGTKLCSEIEGATSVEEARELLGTYFGEQEFWDSDRTREFREIAGAVSDRAAALVAAATIGALGLNDELSFEKGKLVVGFTGTVLEKYSRFRERCQQFLDELAGEGKVQLVGARDGGIIGAAVLAAMLIAGTT